MKTLAACLLIALPTLSVFSDSLPVLYTNMTEGATLVIDSNVSATNRFPDVQVAGIAYEYGEGSGTLEGSGNISFYNTNSTTALAGIYATSLVVSNYSGNLSITATGGSVTNDFSISGAAGMVGSVTGDLNGSVSVSTEGWATSTTNNEARIASSAYGIYGNLNGNLNSTITASAMGGSASDTINSYAATAAYGIQGNLNGDLIGSINASATGGTASFQATAFAAGIYGNMTGDLIGNITASATGGTANVTSATNSETHACANAAGIYGNLTGDLEGNINVSATAGTVTASTNTEIHACADATGIYGSLTGNLIGRLNVSAISGSSSNNSGSAYANAFAYGIDENLNGNLDGSMTVVAEGGVASTDHAYSYADADAEAYGIYGDLNGNLNGSLSVSATGGSSSASAIGDSAEASAEAIGIAGNLIGNLTGSLTVSATGGSANALDGYAYATAYATGVDGDLTGDLDGDLTVTATSFREAYATGIGGVLAGDLNGNITVTATSSNGYASALGANAAGDISGNVTVNATGEAGRTRAIGVRIGSGKTKEMPSLPQPQQFSGHINVTTTITSSRDEAKTLRGYPTAAIGIQAEDPMNLNVTGGSIHVQVLNQLAEIKSPVPTPTSEAIAIMGSYYDDYLSLANVDIVGDIAMGDGFNEIVIKGDTRIKGDIYANGAGTPDTFASKSVSYYDPGGMNILRQESGMLTPVGLVRVRDLNGPMVMLAGSGIRPELYGDPESTLNSKLKIINGGLVVREFDSKESSTEIKGVSVSGKTPTDKGTPGIATIAVTVAAGQKAADIIGNSYEVATADYIYGTFIESEKSLFYSDITQTETNIIATPTGMRAQNGANTGAGSSIAQATVNSAGAVMNDLSAHAGTMRSALRSSGPQGTSGGTGPEGPSGPDAVDTLRSGEWLVYVRQLNDIGAQDSDSSTAGYDWETSGFMIGAEKLVGEGFILGAAAGGAWTDIDGKDGAGGGASEMAMASIYANCFSDTWYTEAGLSCARAWNDAERIATDTQRYMGDYNSDLYGIWMEAGYTMAGEKKKLEPYARTTYVSGNHDSYTDQGGTNPLTIEENGTDNWQVELGLRGSRDWEMKNGDRLTLEVKAGWQCELLDTTVSANGSLLGTDQTLRSPDADRNALALGLKADWQIQDALALEVEYAPTFAGNWYNHAFNAAVKYSF